MSQPDDMPLRPIKILHLEDSVADHELVRFALLKSGETFELERVETLDGFKHRLTAAKFDIILADYRLIGFTALDEPFRSMQNFPTLVPHHLFFCRVQLASLRR